MKYHFVADAGWLDWRHVCFVSSVLLTAPLWRLLFLSRNFLRHGITLQCLPCSGSGSSCLSAIYKMKPTIPRLDNNAEITLRAANASDVFRVQRSAP
ncbi:unnamed protein product [Fusarium graminearum]|uniref:Uncharacterized protein n=1 Tax=Gibberella zeae TaxID=5518 RepID=A0A9N8RI62_GIBZA|nr:unnamed protein product [Fusarium graminearum]